VHGICSKLVSDNGSQFVSEEFKSYLEELGIKHTRVTPYWARANGLVENFNKSEQPELKAKTGITNFIRSYYYTETHHI
jgi:transposase InsO family protein